MPDGTTSYTRDGSFQVDSPRAAWSPPPAWPVANGVTVPANATAVSISAGDGTVSATIPGRLPRKALAPSPWPLHQPGRPDTPGAKPVCESAASGQPNAGTPGTNGMGALMQGFGDLQRQRGAGTGHHDPDPARLRDELQGHSNLGPDVAKTGSTLSVEVNHASFCENQACSPC
jgi:hypothetical protein